MSNETQTAEKKHSVVSVQIPAEPVAPAAPVAPVAPAAVKTVATVTAAKPVSASAAKLQSALADLKSDSTTTRAHAAIDLGKLGDRAAVKPLIESLRDFDADVAREAATSLGLLADPSALEPLIDAVDNSNDYFHTVVRSAAAASLGQLKNARAIDTLLRAVNDSIAEVSAEAIRALAHLGDARAVGPLVEVVRNESGFFADVARRAAVLALGQIGGAEALAELRKVAGNSHEDAVIREDAVQAVARASKDAK